MRCWISLVTACVLLCTVTAMDMKKYVFCTETMNACKVKPRGGTPIMDRLCPGETDAEKACDGKTETIRFGGTEYKVVRCKNAPEDFNVNEWLVENTKEQQPGTEYTNICKNYDASAKWRSRACSIEATDGSISVTRKCPKKGECSKVSYTGEIQKGEKKVEVEAKFCNRTENPEKRETKDKTAKWLGDPRVCSVTVSDQGTATDEDKAAVEKEEDCEEGYNCNVRIEDRMYKGMKLDVGYCDNPISKKERKDVRKKSGARSAHRDNKDENRAFCDRASRACKVQSAGSKGEVIMRSTCLGGDCIRKGGSMTIRKDGKDKKYIFTFCKKTDPGADKKQLRLKGVRDQNTVSDEFKKLCPKVSEKKTSTDIDKLLRKACRMTTKDGEAIEMEKKNGEKIEERDCGEDAECDMSSPRDYTLDGEEVQLYFCTNPDSTGGEKRAKNNQNRGLPKKWCIIKPAGGKKVLDERECEEKTTCSDKVMVEGIEYGKDNTKVDVHLCVKVRKDK